MAIFITVFDFQGDIWNFYHFQTTDTKRLANCKPENFINLLQNAWEHLSLHKGSKKSSEHKAEEVFALICKGATTLHPQTLQDFLQLLSTE